MEKKMETTIIANVCHLSLCLPTENESTENRNIRFMGICPCALICGHHLHVS